MRLIDADELINQGYEVVVDDWQYDTCNKSIDIDNIPTAYDIDKVVEELEEIINPKEMYFCRVSKGRCIHDEDDIKCMDCVAQKAIEIVKQCGVSNDVCKWESVSDREFIQNPHTKRLYSNEPSMQNVYCNTCGKEIKVVE